LTRDLAEQIEALRRHYEGELREAKAWAVYLEAFSSLSAEQIDEAKRGFARAWERRDE
jgi:hypothetical protein